MHKRLSTALLHNYWSLVGIVLAAVFAVIILVGPLLAPYDPSEMCFTPIAPPSGEHLLGVNDCGQDIFSELLHATRNTVLFGIVCGVLALLLGVAVGLTAGWFGGVIDLILMRLADILLAIPAVMILILTAALCRPPPLVLAILLAFFLWPTISKAIRAQTLILRESLHVQAARQMGGTSWYIIFRHLLPEMFPLYLIGFTSKCRMAMFMEASLAFMGLFDPTRKSLGMMISYALKYYYMDIWWNWLLPPVLCLSLLLTTATFLAIGGERVLDPRLQQYYGESGA